MSRQRLSRTFRHTARGRAHPLATHQRVGWVLWLSLLVLALPMSGVASAGDAVAVPDDPLQGRILFESKQCHRCHGITGSGAGIGPDLGAGHFEGSLLELGAALWNHVPGMSVSFETADLPWPEMSEQESTQLFAFLYFIDYLGHPGNAARGERVFDGNCGACHAIGGGEAQVGPDLAELRRFASPLYVAQEIWNHGPSMFESMRRLRMTPPTFRDGELADLSAFIRQRAEPGLRERLLQAPGNPNRGLELFAEKGCSTCHGEDARGGLGGPDLTASELHRPADVIAGTMWNHALAMSDTMRQLGVRWPEFADRELADLVAFLYFLPFADPPGDAERGAQVFADRSCAGCHTPVGGAGEPVAERGPDLAGGSGSASSPAALVATMWSHAPIMKKVILRQGRPWPELSGEDLRDLAAFLSRPPD